MIILHNVRDIIVYVRQKIRLSISFCLEQKLTAEIVCHTRYETARRKSVEVFFWILPNFTSRGEVFLGWLIRCFVDWMADWFVIWFIEWLVTWFVSRIKKIQLGSQPVQSARRVQADTQAGGLTGGQAGRLAGRQSDREEGRQAGGQADMRVERKRRELRKFLRMIRL